MKMQNLLRNFLSAKIPAFFFLIFGCAAIYIGIKITDVNGLDVAEYEHLITSSAGKTSSVLSRLERKNVVKEIWWGTQSPLYVRVQCARSELVAGQGRGTLGALEKMEDVKSLYQEKLFFLLPDGRKASVNREGKVIVKEEEKEGPLLDLSPKTLVPMQDVRYFEAARGMCSYKNLDFIGEDVTMKKYQLRGHAPPSFISERLSPMSIGEGKKMHFLLKDGRIDLRLDGLKTTFNPRSGV